MTEDRSGKQYERTVASALSAIFGVREEDGSLVRNPVLVGASGAGHEIDIVLEVPWKTGKIFLAVECKDHGRPLEKETVVAFSGVLQDVNALRKSGEKLYGIVVSSCGFQSGALEMGKYCRIMLLEIRCPDVREWMRYCRTTMQVDPETGRHVRKADYSVSARTNERIVVVPEKSWLKTNHGWELGTPLGKDAHSLIYLDRNHRGSRFLPELLWSLPSEGDGTHRRVVLKGPESRVYHVVWEESIPVERIEYTYDDLTEDAEETVLYGREKPDLVVYNPVAGWRGGIRNGRFEMYMDPVREIREYDGNVKIHKL